MFLLCLFHAASSLHPTSLISTLMNTYAVTSQDLSLLRTKTFTARLHLWVAQNSEQYKAGPELNQFQLNT